MATRRSAYIYLLMLLAATPAAAQDATPVGMWLDDSERILVKIDPCGDLLCGKLIWFRWPKDDQAMPVADIKNADPTLRMRPLLGLPILYHLHRANENTWEDGEIYNPDDGVNYHVRMSVEDDGSLRVRIYELLPLFGETHIWTRPP